MVCSHASRGSALAIAAVLLMALQDLSASPGGLLTPPAPLTPPLAPRPVSTDVAITSVTASPTPFVMVGSTSTYTFEFRNNGPDTADYVTARLATPVNTTLVSAAVLSGTGWDLDMSPEVGGTGFVVWANSSGLESGATAQFQVVVQVDATTPHFTELAAFPYAYAPDDPVSSNNMTGVITTAMVVADPFEPNDTAATATPIPMGTASNLIFSIAPDQSMVDRDWYKFYVPAADAGKDLKVNVRVTSTYPDPAPAGWGSDLDFSLLDSSLTMKALAISGSDNETLYLHNVAAGWHYICIEYSTTSYAEGEGWAEYEITTATGTAAEFGIGYLTGRVVDGSGNGVEHVLIQADQYPLDRTKSFVSAVSGPTGHFTLASLPGTRYAYFTGAVFSANNPAVNVVDEYYSDKASRAQADIVTVTADATTGLGNVTLDIGAIVTGAVTDGVGALLGDVLVRGFDLAGNRRASAHTDGGAYTLIGIPIGGAKIRFSISGAALEWYDDQPTFGTGTTLATVSGETNSPVNAVLTPGGTIGGTVTDANGTGQALTLALYSTLDSTYPHATTTSAPGTGAYSLTHVKPGSYKIYVNPTGTSFAPEWYDNATSFAAAATVTATEGGTSSGNNITLGTPGGIDFNSDLRADILWHHAANGQVWAWLMNGTAPGSQTYVGTVADTDWEVRAVADFDGNFVADLLWRNRTTGMMYLWTMNATTASAQTYVGMVDVAYDIESYGDYSGDGRADLLWRNPANGELWEWVMNGSAAPAVRFVATIDPAYRIKASGDLDGDGRCDPVWHHGTTGEVWVWLMQDDADPIQAYVGTVPDLHYQIKAVADFDGNGKADILWWNSSDGEVWIWLMNGAVKQSENFVGIVPDTGYQIVR